MVRRSTIELSHHLIYCVFSINLIDAMCFFYAIQERSENFETVKKSIMESSDILTTDDLSSLFRVAALRG